MSQDENNTFNLSTPTTVGALLTEEVAMNPFSPLPSFYEMMLIEEAQRSARKAIKDGMDSVAQQISRQRTQQSLTPSILGKLRNRLLHFVEFLVKKYGPEVRLLIIYFVERRCIMSSSTSTLAESIYGGKRAKALQDGKLGPLTRQDQTRLAVVLSLSWYLDEKLEELLHKWVHPSTAIISGSSNRRKRLQWRMKNIFLMVYPYLRMTQSGSVLAYQFLYLIGKTVYFHPTSHILGIIVRRVTQADDPKQGELASSNENINQGSLQKLMPHIHKAAFWAASSTLMLGWIHQWRQYARAQQRQPQASNLIPPAPKAPPFKLDPRERIRVPENSDVCPLCQQPWIAPSASPAGYVFCRKCLVLYVRERKRCPLTGVQCTENDIVRIYEPQASAA